MSEILQTKIERSNLFIEKKVPETHLITRPKVNVLWTGGFDSSFRMAQLSKLDVDIQPYYLTDKRSSEKNEFKAISAITSDIENHPETRCILAPLIKFNVADIEPDESLTSAYKRLNAISSIGIQYEWIGRFAQKIPGLELSLEKSHASKAYNCILKHGKVTKEHEGQVSYYIVDKKESSNDLIKVFGNYHLPYPIFDLTKQQMLEEYKSLGYENTLGKTWFCHKPIKNEPCGICNPCKSVIEEGLSFRISKAGIQRYNYFLNYGDKKWYRMYYKIRMKIADSV